MVVEPVCLARVGRGQGGEDHPVQPLGRDGVAAQPVVEAAEGEGEVVHGRSSN